MADILGYDPNRDSGIAEARSYVEIPKDALSGMVDDSMNPKGRFFAKLVYSFNGGGRRWQRFYYR